MHLIYIDDSRDEKICVFSALSVPAVEWKNCFAGIRDFRRQLKNTDGIYVYKEFHAWKFVSGRGRIADRVVPKSRRVQIFNESLTLLSSLPIRLFNAISSSGEDERCFEWLLNRINRNMGVSDSHAVLICDEGKEAIYTRLTRRMGTYNPIPSQFGKWNETGQASRNIPIDRVLEDPFFKKSENSREGGGAASCRTIRRLACDEFSRVEAVAPKKRRRTSGCTRREMFRPIVLDIGNRKRCFRIRCKKTT